MKKCNRRLTPWANISRINSMIPAAWFTGCIILLAAHLTALTGQLPPTIHMPATILSHDRPLQQPPEPTVDPLAIPTLPANPTQIELGQHIYYYNCMPCHGDHGQGLTDEWRQVWEEDHQNCWARGCHGGRSRDEGFPIPTTIPAVMLDSDALQGFNQPDTLYTYLRLTHPPQEPGRLADDDYQALVAYLWSANYKDNPQPAPTPAAASTPPAALGAGILAVLLLLVMLTLYLARHSSRPGDLDR